MRWMDWIATGSATAINLHAFAAVVFSRGQPAPVVSAWARRTGLLAAAFVLLACGAFVVVTLNGIAAVRDADLDMRATRFARMISEGINCVGFGFGGAMMPVVIALWLARKARAQGPAPTAP